MNLIILFINSLPIPDSIKDLFALHPIILSTMVGFSLFISFLIFPYAFLSEDNPRSSSVLKFAPSVMTSLGLLGTFWSLISSLGMLGDSINGGQVDMQGISSFMSGLEKVFYFSVIGIGGAIIFMFLNLLVSQKNSKKSQEERWMVVNHQYELNESSNQELKQQSEFLKTTSSSIQTLASSMSNLQMGYDVDVLGKTISREIKQALTEPLNNIATALNSNQGDTIRQLLIQLTQQVLAPIKNEIAKTTQSTNQVVEVVQKSQDINTQLLEKLGSTNAQMTAFVENTGRLVSQMIEAIDDMQKLQEKQASMLSDFNNKLASNLAKIEPAIKEGMTTAQEAMVEAIEQTTQEMNQAMSGVIDGIATKVVDNLDDVLGRFDENMNGHLTRMNTELEKTGERSQGLIDSSAKALQETLGEIDQTLEQSSQKLKEELKAFRDEYQFSLTDFFTKQNQALEQTLGVQSERLQKTAKQLGEQFDNMKTAQEDINKNYQNVLDKMPKVYEPLLNKMITVSANLEQGQHEMIKNLKEMQEHTQEINQALSDLGKNMPQEFGKAFELLNQTYIDKFNTSNQMLEKSMKEFTTAAAALITTSQVNQQN